jgi:hypothetical protein
MSGGRLFNYALTRPGGRIRLPILTAFEIEWMTDSTVKWVSSPQRKQLVLRPDSVRGRLLTNLLTFTWTFASTAFSAAVFPESWPWRAAATSRSRALSSTEAAGRIPEISSSGREGGLSHDIALQMDLAFDPRHMATNSLSSVDFPQPNGQQDMVRGDGPG